MESFRWDECFITGVPVIDEQHRHLVEVINHFGETLTARQGASAGDIEQVLDELVNYAAVHFSAEAEFMDRSGVDGRHAGPHQQMHADFMSEVLQMRRGVASGEIAAAERLLKFLVHWLAYHILGVDQSLARESGAIAAGRTPAQAHDDEQEKKEGAVGPLLHALTGLFQQVTERNRELSELNRTLETKVAERTQALVEANQRLQDIANTDALTGLPNRRHALRTFESEWRQATETGGPIACMMIDADHFKRINDTQGHDAGDAVLRVLARQLRYSVRTDDLVCRLGGDEFLVICPRTPIHGAMMLAEQVRAAVASLRVPAGNDVWEGSISVGVGARTKTMTCVEDLMKAADEGVYVAKRSGRNFVGTVIPFLPSSVPSPTRPKE
ncbi:MAG: bacteriohemerythrin [Deltaproteobacteria bacterium]|nr:bacteriohemerythrin [Deltaproteobacteria bacterium]